MKKEKTELTFIDFFAGIGGFHLGMSMAGFRCVGFCEVDKHAVRSYKAMHLLTDGELEELRKIDRKSAIRFIDRVIPQERGIWYANDIRTVVPGDIPRADVFTFGFPCQSFSIAGKRRGIADTRGTLFFEVMRLAQVQHPVYLFAENVEGLLSHDRGSTFATILSAMAELGYGAEWQVVDSAAYLPQHRERVYIIGHLRNGCGEKIFPFRPGDPRSAAGDGESAPADVAPTVTTRAGAGGAWATYVLPESGSGPVKQIGNLREQAGWKNPQDGRIYSPHDISPTLNTAHEPLVVLPCMAPNRLNGRQRGRRIKNNKENMFTLTAENQHGVIISKPHGFNKGGIKDSAVAPTITVQNQSNSYFYNGSEIRRLTPRECFRLQGFSDIYFERAALVCSDAQLYKQAGNSVTVDVIYEIAKRLRGETEEKA